MSGYHVARGGAALRLGGEAAPLPVTRLSPVDVTFVASRRLALGERVELQLEGVPGPLAAVVAAAAGGEVTADFAGVTPMQARQLARHLDGMLERRQAANAPPLILEREVVTAPARVREILHALFANRCHARLHRLDGSGRWTRIVPGRVEPQSRTPLHFECEEEWPPPPFRITVDGYMSLVELRVDEARLEDGFLAVPVPAELTRIRSRWQRRVAVDDVVLSFRHPRWPDLQVRRPVRNVSHDGVLFSCSAVKDLVWPGLQLADATVTFRDRIVCRVGGEVRHVSDDIDGEGQLAGLLLRVDRPDDRQHWREEVDKLLYPNTRMDGSWSDQLWELYRVSGYLELSQKNEAEFVALKEAFSSTGRRMAEAGIGCQVVWPSARGVESSLSILRNYEQGAFIYQLARRPGRVPMRFPGREILRDVYLHAIEDLERMREVGWLIGWVQKEARFSKLVHVEMAKRHLASGRALIWRFRAMELGVDGPRVPLPDGWSIAPATAREVGLLLDHVAATRTRHYLEAHDLLPATFEQRKLKQKWAAGGFARDRQVLVASHGGRPMAAALLESAEDGLHLFRLLDVARVYALAEGGAAAFGALVDAARRFYAERRKAKFIYFLEGDDLSHAQAAGAVDLGEADCVLLPASLLPELLEHVYEVTAPRDVPRLRAP